MNRDRWLDKVYSGSFNDNELFVAIALEVRRYFSWRDDPPYPYLTGRGIDDPWGDPHKNLYKLIAEAEKRNLI